MSSVNGAKARRPKLTLKQLRAINSALSAYLAGEPMEDDANAREDYARAQAWVQGEIHRYVTR